MVTCTPRSRLIFTFVIPASCLFIILIFRAKKKVIVFFGCFSTIINFLVGNHLVCACHGAVLGSEIRSAQHIRLLAANADARLILNTFLVPKVLEWVVQWCCLLSLQRTSSIPYVYYTIWYVFDGCGKYFWPHLILKNRVKFKYLSRAMGGHGCKL